MAVLPRLQMLAVPTPNTGLDQQAALMLNQGVSALANAVRGFGTDVRNQNTNDLITQAAGVSSLDALPGQRESLLAGIAGLGNAVDGTKVLDALNKQENQLYTSQNNLNQLDQYRRNVLNEQNRQNDLKLLADPTLIQNAMKGDKAALASISEFSDPTRIIEMYQSGVRNEQQLKQYEQNRQDRLKQQDFDNNLSIERQNLTVADKLNPNPGQSTTTVQRDANGNLVEVSQTTPSLASTMATVANNRNSNGTLNWGNTAGASAPKPIQNAVSSNLTSLSKNLTGGNPELTAVVNKLNIRDPNVLAMMAIESGGGGMNADSGSSVGPMQLNRKYAQADARKYGIAGNPLTDMETNVRVGIAKMKDLSSKFNGNKDAIAIGYNGGEYAAKVAYDAWNKSGQKGRVMDYVPSAYKSKEGKNVNYDVGQMKAHAQKFEAAVGLLSQASPSRTQTKPAGSQGFSFGGDILTNARKEFNDEVKKNQFGVNTQGRAASSTINKNGLQMFLDDNKISSSGSAWGSLMRDSQNVFNNLSKNPEFNNLSPLDQKDILGKAIKFNKDNQGWLGVNPDTKTKERMNLEMQNLIQAKKQAYEEKTFSSLRSSAEKALATEAKRKGRSGPLPSIDQMMEFINPSIYNTMRERDKKVNNPF